MLLRDERYTVKVKSARLFNVISESTIKDRAASLFSGFATVTSVERPTLTQYYLFRLLMLRNGTEYEAAERARRTMNEEGFDNAEVLSIERGTESTNILKEATTEAAKGLKPLADPLASFALYALGVAAFGLAALIILKGGKD